MSQQNRPFKLDEYRHARVATITRSINSPALANDLGTSLSRMLADIPQSNDGTPGALIIDFSHCDQPSPPLDLAGNLLRIHHDLGDPSRSPHMSGPLKIVAPAGGHVRMTLRETGALGRVDFYDSLNDALASCGIQHTSPSTNMQAEKLNTLSKPAKRNHA